MGQPVWSRSGFAYSISEPILIRFKSISMSSVFIVCFHGSSSPLLTSGNRLCCTLQSCQPLLCIFLGSVKHEVKSLYRFYTLIFISKIHPPTEDRVGTLEGTGERWEEGEIHLTHWENSGGEKNTGICKSVRRECVIWSGYRIIRMSIALSAWASRYLRGHRGVDDGCVEGCVGTGND